MAESSRDSPTASKVRVRGSEHVSLRSPQKQVHIHATMLWQSYHESSIRKDEEDAEVKLLNFFSHMCEHTPDKTAIGGMPIASKLGLDTQSFMFRDFSDVWLSTRLPSNMLTDLEKVFDGLRSKLQAETSTVVSTKQSSLRPIVVEILHSSLRFMACLSGRKENHTRLLQSKFTMEVASLGSLLVRWTESLIDDKENGWKFVEMVTSCLLYIHGLYDPARMWKLRFVRELKTVGHIRGKPQYLPPGVEELFLECFKAELSSLVDSNDSILALQKEALHLFGGVISAHESNAFQMISPRSTGLVLSLLDPRERCTALQELASKVFIKMIHIMHSKPGSELFEIDVLISGYLSFLGPRIEEGHFVKPCAEFLILILDSLSRLMTVTANKNDLSLILVRVGCFEKINNVFALLEDMPAAQVVSITTCLLRAVRSLIRGSTSVRKRFLENRGFHLLFEGIKHCNVNDDFILKEFISLATEESVSSGITTQTIKNPKVIHILLNWIPELNRKHQLLLLDNLILLVPNSIFNHHQCCKEGIIEVLLSILGSSQTNERYLGAEVEERLCLLFEVLAGHSVTSHHVKQLFSILRPFSNQMLPTYYPRLIQSIHSISVNTSRNLPHYYFDMSNPESYISMPKLKHWCTDGFTFCGWLNVSKMERQSAGKQPSTVMRRRMLYSIHSSRNAGFQAFLWEDILVVAVVTKKNYITINVPVEALFTGWHHVTVVYSLQGKFQKTCEVTVYIDGRACCKENVKAPAVTESTEWGFIGSGHDRTKVETDADSLFSITVSTIEPSSGFVVVSEDILPMYTPLGSEMDRWGTMTSLQGLLGPLCLFNEALTSNCVKHLNSVNPNEYSLFQPNTKLCDAASKLVVYYHPKACSLTTVYDLAPPSISGRGSSAKIVGECYTAFKLKDVLTALGGVQSLLPLLEYIRQPVCIFHSPSEGEPDEVSAEKRVFDARGTTSVSLFMSILTTMLTSNPVNLQLFGLNDGPAILGALLAKVPPEQITVPVLGSLQLLIESALHSSTNEEKLPPIVKHVLFNFIIWTKPAYDVRIGHIQYLGAVVKDRPSLCHKEWGPQFLLDIISRYYLPGHMDEEESDVRLTVEQASHIRVGLLSCIKYYAHSELSAQEVDDIVHFTLAVGDEDVQLEMLQLILDLVLKRNIGDSLPSILTDVGAPLVAFMKAPQIKIRLLVTQVFCALFNTRGISSGRAHDCLQHGAVESAVHNMLNHTLSSALIIALMELCVRKSDSFTDYISSLGVYMALLDLLKKLDMVVRYTVCQQTLSLLHFNPHHIGEVTGCPQWEVTLLGLLSSTREAKSPSPTNFPMSPGSPGEAPSLGSGTPVDMPTRLLSIVMEIVGLILWGAATSGDHVKVWRRFFLYVDLYSEDNEMMLPAHILKQHIFDTLIKLLKRQVDEMGPSGVTTLCRPALTLSVLFEEFVTGNHMIDLPQSPVHQLVYLALDPKRCTPELLKSFLSLMQSLGIYQSHFIDSNEVALCRVINRLLLACLCQNNREYCCYGARELQEFLNSSKMSANDGFFTLLCLVQALDQCGDSDLESDCRDYIVTAVRSLLLKFGQVLNTLTLKHLPAVESNPMFVKEFLTYRKSEEWEYFMRDKVRKSCGVFCTEALIPDVEKMKFITEELRKDIQTAEGERQALLSQNDRYYNLQVLDTVVMILEKENNRPTAIHQLEGQHQTAVNVWKQAKRFFKEERGVWSSRKSDKYSWKLDRTENFSRMRMKLSRSYPYNSHTEASILRDQGDIAPSEVKNIVKELLKVKDSVLPSVLPDGGSNTDDLFDEAESTLVETPTLPKQFDGLTDAVERSVCDVKCQLVLLTEKFNGSLEVTTTHISFEPEKKESRDSFWYNNDFKIPIVQLREIHSRRYNLVRTALEFFLIDQTNYFVNFESRRDVRKVFNCIVAQNTPNLIYKKLRTPRELLESSELTKKWIRREISNFDYLMQLNTIAGRTYNDLNQYPVFPWILKDYTSPTLDLTSSAVFRDLSKPMGCQSEALELQAIERYEEFEDPTGDIPKFHYGTHYSNAAGVMHYLLRLEPFTTLHIQLQSGRFDATARQFISLGRSYQSILATSSDVKELIPEFFYLPEMFVNLNRYNLGKTGAEVVDSVELPTWASSAEDFVRKHKEALESEHVSQHLHEWIDLIFGFKQQGPEAVKALNVFYYCTYEGKVDLSNASQSNREVLEKMIESFGQTPSQLFKSPHPTRLSVEEASKALRAEYQSGSAHNDFCNIFENFEELKAYAVDISSQDPIVFVSIPAVRGHAIIESGNPEKLITVTASGVLNIHSWLSAHFAFKKRPFVFHIDPNTYEDRSKWHYLGGPFAHNVAPSQNMFVASRTNKLLVSGGHWDNSFRVISSDKGKIIARVEYHQDIVTCMSLDPSGAHLITGSRDLTCAIWDFGKEAKLFEHPLRTLYGHDDVVTCVDISLELDIAVSGSQDGTVIIHTVQQGRYVHTLKPESVSEDEHRPRVVRLVAISKKGRIVVYSELQPSVDKVRLDPCLHLYSINGKLLLSESAKDRITAMLIHEGFLVTGSDSGVLLFRDIFDLMRLTRLDVKAGVSCLALTRELSHLLVGLENGKLLIVSPPKKR